MKAPLMFSLKRGLGSRLVVVAIIVSIVVPQTYMLSLPLAFAEDEVASSDTSASDASVESESTREPEAPAPAITVENDSAPVETADTVVPSVDADVSVSPVTPAADEVPATDVPTDTDTSVDTDTVTPADTDGSTPTDGSEPQAPESTNFAGPQTGSITVCNVIAKADGQVVTSPAGLPNAGFSLNLRERIGTATPVQTSAPIQETNFYSHLFTQTSPSPIPLSAQCLKYNNLPIKQYIYSQVTVSSLIHDRWETPKYNDQYANAVNSTSDFYTYSTEMFDNDQANDAQRNENSDGIVTLTVQRPDRVVVIFNKLKPVVPATSGTIMVCKIIQDNNGHLVTMGGPQVPPATFSVMFTGATTPSAISRTATWDSNHYMTTWPSPGADPASTASALDADCQTFDNLPFDSQGYLYREEVITGSGANYYVVPRYNDGATQIPNRFSNFYHYGPGIYGDDQIPGLSNNPNSDGRVMLTPEEPVAKIFVLNQYNAYTPPAPPVCANGVSLTGAEFIQNRDLGYITFSLGPQGPTSDPEHIIIHASSTFAKFHITNNTGCTIPLGMGSYKVFSQFEWQEVYDIVEQVNATSSTDIYVNVPNCMAQVDVFFGRGDRVLQPYGPNGENPYIYPGAQGNFIFIAGFYFPNHQTWGDLPASYCPRTPVNTPPTITLNGDNPMTVYLHTTFNDPGATAQDAEDGNLTSQIVTTGAVDEDVLGSYTMTYTVTDSGGLTASVTRTVNVVENPDGGDGDDDDDNNGGGNRRNGQRRSSGGEVLGAETGPTACFYLRDYLRRDFNNDPSEVLKLQFFLKYFEGETNLEATGTFDQATFDAVSRFQTKYFSDILNPWGHTAPTGYVYILTKKKVNEIFCQTAFPVNAQQQDEIDNFRAFLQGLKDRGIEVPSDGSMMMDDHMMDIDNMVGVGTSTGSGIGKMVKDKIDTKNLKAVAAAIFSVPHDRETILQSIYFLLIALIAIYLFTEIIVGSRDSSKLTKYQVWSRKATGYLAGLIIAIIAAIWYQVFSIVVPLLVLAIASGVFLAWTMTKKEGSEVINLPPSNR